MVVEVAVSSPSNQSPAPRKGRAPRQPSRSPQQRAQQSSEVAPDAAVTAPPRQMDAPRRWRWTSEQYLRLSESGLFDGRRVELIDGEIIEMAAMTDRHWLAVALASGVLSRVYSEGFFVNVQCPLRISDINHPEPDVALYRGSPRDYTGTIPSSAELVVEISLSTLEYDRGDKASLYASAAVPEYWIVNLAEEQLEIYRRPIALPSACFGWGFAERLILRRDEQAATLFAPTAMVPVADLLP